MMIMPLAVARADGRALVVARATPTARPARHVDVRPGPCATIDRQARVPYKNRKNRKSPVTS